MFGTDMMGSDMAFGMGFGMGIDPAISRLLLTPPVHGGSVGSSKNDEAKQAAVKTVTVAKNNGNWFTNLFTKSEKKAKEEAELTNPAVVVPPKKEEEAELTDPAVVVPPKKEEEAELTDPAVVVPPKKEEEAEITAPAVVVPPKKEEVTVQTAPVMEKTEEKSQVKTEKGPSTREVVSETLGTEKGSKSKKTESGPVSAEDSATSKKSKKTLRATLAEKKKSTLTEKKESTWTTFNNKYIVIQSADKRMVKVAKVFALILKWTIALPITFVGMTSAYFYDMWSARQLENEAKQTAAKKIIA